MGWLDYKLNCIYGEGITLSFINFHAIMDVIFDSHTQSFVSAVSIPESFEEAVWATQVWSEQTQ